MGIFASRSGTPVGVLYDVVTGASSDPANYLGFGKSILKVRTLPLSSLKSEGYRTLSIAKRSAVLFAMYQVALTAETIALDQTKRIPLTLPFGYFGPVPPWALNCTVWVAGASVTAVSLSVLPL
jgi:hypothetical protein